MTGVVYIATANRPGLKIGQTINPQRRLYGLRSMEKCRVEMVYQHPSKHQKFLEFWTHLFLKPFHIRGDWFDVSEELARASIEMLSPRVDEHKVLMERREPIFDMPYGDERNDAFKAIDREIESNMAPIDMFRNRTGVTEQEVLQWIDPKR